MVPSEKSTLSLLRRFWDGFASRHWRFFTLGLACMGLVAATTAAYALFIQWVTDLLAVRDGSFLWVLPMVLTITLIRGGSIYFQNVLTNVAVLRSLRDMQSVLFSHLLNADLAQVERQPPGKILTRFTNDFVVVREMLWRATTGIRDSAQIIALTATMIYFDWVLTLLVLVVYPVAAIPITKIGKKLRSASLDTQNHLGEMTAVLHESLSGARMVKTFRLENFEKSRAAGQFQKMYSLYLTIVRNRSRLDPVMEVLGGIAVGGVIAVGGMRVVDGSSSIGELVGFIAALLLLAPALRAIGTLNNVLQEGLAAVDRIFEILDEPSTIRDAGNARELDLRDGRIQLAHVDFGYDADNLVLTDFSITVEPGTTVALVGPSGAGKSTVLNLIPRLYDAKAGHVKIDGQDVRGVTLASLRDAIALVSQDVILFNDTVRANIALGRLDATDAEIEAAARSAAAHEFIEALPEGFDTVVGERGLKLSGGQRQRIAIARAMLKDPKILLLDEATSALDTESEMRVQEALDRLRAGRTTLVIAHRLSTVRDADKIYVIDEGHVREEGDHERLLATDGLYANLSKLQFRSLDAPMTSASNQNGQPSDADRDDGDGDEAEQARREAETG